MIYGVPEGFERCEQCGALHKPISGVCVWRLTKDAAFVLDATGAAIGTDMIARVLGELDSREGHRFVSSPEQQHAYLLSGNALTVGRGGHKYASDGAEWMLRADLPEDVLLVETSGGFGLIKRLQVPAARTQEEE